MSLDGVLLGEVTGKTAKRNAQKRGIVGKFIPKGKNIESQMITMVN